MPTGKTTGRQLENVNCQMLNVIDNKFHYFCYFIESFYSFLNGKKFNNSVE